MTRHVIIGAGAVGASLAAQFEEAGVPYALVGRGAQIAHIRAQGLTYRRPSGARDLRLNAFDAEEPPELSAGDVLLLTVKTQDVEAATAFWARRPLREGGTAGGSLPIVTFQNGLAAETIALRRFARVYGASILTPSVYTQTGEVSCFGHPQAGVVTLGRYPGGLDALAEGLAADLVKADYIAEARADIPRWKAAKLLHNVRNVVELFDADPESAAAFGAALSEEAARVLRAAGHEVSDPSERRVSLAGWSKAPGSPSGQSTWQSVARGAPHEVDYLNGEIVLLGRAHGVGTPYNAAAQEAAAELTRTGADFGALRALADRFAQAAA
ncbi:ketopantoate reductase family protein [Neomegalonema sp.]|uniref:ketopantoate reductase family protein n=1 Tax=Neomegalonema sp. TaxID=2039713 RepID=UPI0026399BAE|nr:2-dehydropantoate 2-reductase N-terminal domain-containing protein [Neomegalonema sp.]MDD2867388.1 2-dehydropantoate 2-reductase N-terminal domain-containing protein [Neomegalonema sp.]